MPAPLDLSGQRFGKLLVLKDTGRKLETLSKESRLWLCQCDCGREEEIPQLRIPSSPSKAKRRGARYACTVCMRGACVICGSEILTDQYLNVCSHQCAEERRRQQFREYHYRKLKENPNYWGGLAAKRREREALLSPEEIRERLDKQNARKRRWTEQNRERYNAAARERYWRNHRENLKKKRAYISKNIGKIRLRNKKYHAEYWQQYGDEIIKKRHQKINAMSDAEYRQYREQQNRRNRQLYHERKRKEAMEEMAKLNRRFNDGANND